MHQYNPAIHHRRSIRLKGYDYTQAGLYFVTICCHNLRKRFGYIENGEMMLNEFGRIAHDEWLKLPERFPNFELDVFQIMPNHLHAIILLVSPAPVGATLAVAPDAENPQLPKGQEEGQEEGQEGQEEGQEGQEEGQEGQEGQPQGLPVRSVGDIVGAYKSLVANGCLEISKLKNEYMGKLWQRNYYEHIIRNEQSYRRISEYIMNNPANWSVDKYN